MSRQRPPIREEFNEQLIGTGGEIVKEYYFLVADRAWLPPSRTSHFMPTFRGDSARVVTNHIDQDEPCAGDHAMAEVGGIGEDGDTLQPSPTCRQKASHGTLVGSNSTSHRFIGVASICASDKPDSPSADPKIRKSSDLPTSP